MNCAKLNCAKLNCAKLTAASTDAHPGSPPFTREVVQLGAMVAASRIEPKIAECRMLNFQVKTATRRFLTSPIDIQHSAFCGSIAWSFSDRPSCTTTRGGRGGSKIMPGCARIPLQLASMKSKHGLSCLFVSVFVACLPSVLAAAGGKLNILLIVSDDLRDTVGCYGNAAVKTPNLDRLAVRGCVLIAPTHNTRSAIPAARLS